MRTQPLGEVVLLGERDPYAAELAEFFLRTEGYDVCMAMDATQARALFEERSPDLVIIDLLISGGGGFRLCREFAAKGQGQILAVSVLDSADEAVLAGASGSSESRSSRSSWSPLFATSWEPALWLARLAGRASPRERSA